MREITNRLDAVTREQQSGLRQLENEANKQMNGLDSATRMSLEEMKRIVQSIQMSQQMDNERLLSRATGYTDKEIVSLNTKQV